MDSYTFALKRPLILPSSSISKALLFFRADVFGLSYSMMPNPKEAYMVVTLTVVNIQTGETALELASYTITEKGFSTGVITNAAEIAAWVSSATTIEGGVALKSGQLYLKQGEEYALIAAAQEVPKELTDEIAALTGEIATLQAQLVALGEKPEPVELFINKYSDVLQYFDNKGAITEEGIAWARNIPFLGLKLGDFIV